MAFNPNNPTHNDDPDLTLYARPTSSTALAWDGDAVNGEEATFGGNGIGSYSFAVDLNRNWVIYEQLGASPAATDTPIATIEADPRRSDRLTLMAAGGTLTDVEWTYDTEQTNPELKVYRGASLESSPAATGTGRTFYFDVAIPADAGVGEIIRVLTDEDPAREVLIGQVVSTSSLEVESGQVAQSVIAGLGSDRIIRLGPGYNPSTGSWVLIKGNDHVFALNGHEDFSLELPGIDLSTATAKVGAKSKNYGQFDGVATIVASGDGYVLRIEWPKENLEDACPGDDYVVHAKVVNQAGSLELTKASGPLVLLEDSTQSGS